MKQLSEQELNQKIANFLENRFAAHPEIGKLETKKNAGKELNVVSRVKEFSKRFITTQAPSFHQS